MNNHKVRKSLVRTGLAVSALSIPLVTLTADQAGATTSAEAHLIWGLFGAGPYSCSTEVAHLPDFGGALASTGTPDPMYGGTSCWSTYSWIYTTAGHNKESAGGNPSSAVVISGETPSYSKHLACYGVFDCDSTWYTLP